MRRTEGSIWGEFGREAGLGCAVTGVFAAPFLCAMLAWGAHEAVNNPGIGGRLAIPGNLAVIDAEVFQLGIGGPLPSRGNQAKFHFRAGGHSMYIGINFLYPNPNQRGDLVLPNEMFVEFD